MKTIYQHHLQEQEEALRHDTANRLRDYLNREAEWRKQFQRINDIDKLVVWFLGVGAGVLATLILQ
jgi:hypothetical protein